MTQPRLPVPSPRTVALVLVASTCAGTLVACREGRQPTQVGRTVIPDSAEQVMFGLRHALTVSGVRRGELTADTALFYDNTTRVEMRGVKTYFFTATGDSNAVMTGRTGTYEVNLKRIVGRGDVRVTAQDGRVLTSPHLVWDGGINQISSDSAFTFRQPGRSEISGVGFRSDPGLRNVQVLSGARGSGVIGRGARR